MPLTWIEDSSSRSATIFRLGRKDASTRTRVFHVIGTNDEDTLHAAANTAISTTYPYWTYPGQPTVNLRAESYNVEYEGDLAWKVTIAYEKTGADDGSQGGPLKRVRSFDTTGGTTHITQGRTDNNKAPEKRFGPPGQGAADMRGAINVDDNGVNGVDIMVPALTWTEQYDVPSNYVTSAYIRAVHLMTASTNAQPFRGFAVGEVLFAGMSGSQEWDNQKGDGPWSLSYKFVASPNRGTANNGLPPEAIGDIVSYEKNGHDYLWVRYAQIADTSRNTTVRVPVAVYVNRVYPESNFAVLGIGVA